MRCLLAACSFPLVSGLLSVKNADSDASCITEDLKYRAQFQNKLAGVCEDMCKEVGAYPKCSQCANFVTPDATPGVMTWPELLEHMDNLVAWGQGELKSWRKAAAGSALQLKHIPLSAVEQRVSVTEQACQADALKYRVQFQNRLAGVCEDMCKEVGAYPKCSQCANFVTPDSTPGVMTWPELLEHMDNLVAWGQGQLKTWRSTAAGSALQLQHVPLSAVAQKTAVSEQACMSEDLSHRMQLQNKLAGVCEDMCKEVGAYPKCGQCLNFVAPDATPGVVTWPELLEHMDNLVAWGQGELKAWRKTAAGSALQLKVK